MNIQKVDQGILISEMPDLNLDETLDCGQCFRFFKQEDGSYQGIAKNTWLHISQVTENSFLLHGCSEPDFKDIWFDYFDFGCDYAKLKEQYSSDETMRNAMQFAPGIRVIRQDPWEALCTFIFSQNNNISRIKGIVSRFCETFGEKIAEDRYAFPTPQSICEKSVDDLGALRCGFRAKYLLDAAQKVANGEIDLASVYDLPIEEARETLQKIKGVGPKVCDCVLLYGFHRIDAFPVDVWIKRVLERFYPNGIPHCMIGTQGIAQQYLFHYIRHLDQAQEANA